MEALVESLRKAPSISAPIIRTAISESLNELASNTKVGVVPVRTGFLLQSFGMNLEGFRGTWGPSVNYGVLYANMVEFGTGPHRIYPKFRQALWWPGLPHPVAYSNHPGTKANKYMERILALSQAGINDIFGGAVEQIISAISS